MRKKQFPKPETPFMFSVFSRRSWVLLTPYNWKYDCWIKCAGESCKENSLYKRHTEYRS